MLLVDTSVWVEHLRRGVPELEALLFEGQAACHPFVIGELACGSLRNRKEILALLRDLSSVPEVTDEELLFFVERHRLMGRGLGLIDAHLLAAAHVAGVALWTLDRRLRDAARALDVVQP